MYRKKYFHKAHDKDTATFEMCIVVEGSICSMWIAVAAHAHTRTARPLNHCPTVLGCPNRTLSLTRFDDSLSHVLTPRHLPVERAHCSL